MVPPLLVVVAPLPLKANKAGGLLLFGIDTSTATVRRLGLDDPGVTPVTVPVVAVTLVTPGPVGAVTLATPGPVGAVTLATPGPVGAVTPVTAVPVVIPALVKNEFCVVVTPVTALANVGVTDVTTVWPDVPLTPLMTLAKVGLTLVTHVAAEAEDTSAVLRLPTVTAARSVWFEADANSANRTVGRRGTIVCFC
jgi:hypothetical protein